MGKPSESKSIWSGVYERFDQVTRKETLFNTPLWADKQQARVLQTLKQSKAVNAIPDGAKSRDYPVFTIIAGLLTKEKKLSILDCGGSMGQTYIELAAKIPDAQKLVSWTVLETHAVVDTVPDDVRKIPNLQFISDLNESGKSDIVHLGSTLHYIEDWQGYLDSLIKKINPDLFILSDLLVGDIPTFVTAQQYYDAVIPVQCINIDEFLKFWSATQYRLKYRSYYYPLQTEEYFPTHDLPETHRIKTACHLVFAKH